MRLLPGFKELAADQLTGWGLSQEDAEMAIDQIWPTVWAGLTEQADDCLVVDETKEN